jgi:penicillin amidase
LLYFCPIHPIFDREDTENDETAPELLVLTLTESLQKFESLDSDTRKWGKNKASEIRHVSRIPGFGEKIINGGHGSALNAMTSTNGPSWRLIVSMEKPLKAFGIYPGGQSGNPGSPYYNTSVEKWKNGGYYELLLTSNPDEIDEPKQKLIFKNVK